MRVGVPPLAPHDLGVFESTFHYSRLMHEAWWEETVHALVAMHDRKQQKQLEAAIRDLVRFAIERGGAKRTSRGTKTGSEGRSTEV